MTENYGARLAWEIGVDFPEWGNTPYYIATITGSKQGKDVNNIGYLLPNETPRDAYNRVAKSVSHYIGKPELADKFFDYIWRGWLCLASPVLSNSGTDRGLPISCYGVSVNDSIYSIGEKTKEMMLLTKEGGGVGVDFSNIRPSGTPIGKANGTTNGVVPFCKIFDSAILATSQGSVRKGSIAINLDIDHPDFEDWLNIRTPKGDVDRQCMHLHQAAVIKDDFMHRLLAGDKDAKRKWTKLLQARKETGEPYVVYRDNINKANPLAYKQNNLDVSMSNICCEISLYTDEYHSFVCCLSSLNLTKYDEWKDTDLVETSIIFLNGALNEFIEKGSKVKGLECAVRSAVKGRALGLGVLGWGSLLQAKNLPFESKEANELTTEIFSLMKEQAEKTSRQLALEYGEPEWCIGTGMYNTHLLAVAPTVSNSKLSGDVSPGIEPWTANYFAEEGKMDYTRKNKKLEEILEELGLNTSYMWKRILADSGSIQGIDELEGWYLASDTGKLTRNNKVGYSVKEIFKTFVEINQMNIIIQQSIRQEYIDQSVSLNLMFSIDASPKFISQVHLEAWRLGIKTLYYYHNSSAAIKADTGLNTMPTCTSCDG